MVRGSVAFEMVIVSAGRRSTQCHPHLYRLPIVWM